jgi:UDP:flavonoid glycosyltransferase YjiC (YdhE family)
MKIPNQNSRFPFSATEARRLSNWIRRFLTCAAYFSCVETNERKTGRALAAELTAEILRKKKRKEKKKKELVEMYKISKF